MRTWQFVEPGPGDEPVVVRKTDEQVLAEYFKHWWEQMLWAGKSDEEITPEACIQDWVAANWATEVKDAEDRD